MNTFSVYEDIVNILNPQNKRLSIKTSWEDIIYISSRQLITCAISSALKEKGLFNNLSKDLKKYFLYIESLNKERNFKIKKQTIEMIKILNNAGIEPILLKGVSYIFRELYYDLSTRIIGDIDILIPEEKIEKTMALLLENGYKYFEYNTSFEGHHHLTPVFHEEKIARVEIHKMPTNPIYKELFSLDEFFENAQYIEFSGAKFFLPSLEDSIVLIISHSELSNKDYHFLRISLKDLYDFLLLSEKKGIDWERIEKRFKRYKGVYKSYLFMVFKFFEITYLKEKFSVYEKFYWFLNKSTLKYPRKAKFIIFFFILLRILPDKGIKNMVFSHINKLFQKDKRIKLFSDLKKAINKRREEYGREKRNKIFP